MAFIPPITVSGSSSGPVTESDVLNLVSDLAGKLEASNNLSDLQSASAARTHLGLGTAATQSASAFDAAGAASSAAAASLPLTGGTLTGNISLGGHNITSVGSIAATTITGSLTGNVTGTISGNIAESQVTGLTASLATLLPVAGGTISGDLAVDGATSLDGGLIETDGNGTLTVKSFVLQTVGGSNFATFAYDDDLGVTITDGLGNSVNIDSDNNGMQLNIGTDFGVQSLLNKYIDFTVGV